MITSKALIYRSYGKPSEVLEIVDKQLDSPGEGELLVKFLAAPVHPSDFGMVLGKYGKLRELPADGGREGVAEVIEVGAGVEGFVPGDRVVVRGDVGTWQTHAVAAADQFMKVPQDLSVEAAATLLVNPPTAWRLLRDAHLSEGDWVVQNAANSAVGMNVIEMARHLGLKTLNVVRREELIEPLLELGADHVVTGTSGYEKRVKELTGGAPVRLALNSVGGESAMRLVKALSANGTHVTFGAMAFEAIRFPTRNLIFEGLVMKGFWMDKWYREHSQTRVSVMFERLFDLMRTGVVEPRIAREFSLEDHAEAMELAQQPRLGKVMFRM
jgi:trans-2-enoyl-CoA reductase